MLYPYKQVDPETKVYNVELPIKDVKFQLSFWNRVRLFFGYKCVVSFDPPLSQNGITVRVGNVER